MKTSSEKQSATLDEALKIIAESCSTGPTESVSLSEATGRVLREPIVATEDQPPFDRSSVDGYAMLQDDDASEFKVVDRIRAGEWKQVPLAKGQAVQIATGGAMPSPGLIIVMKENVQANGDTIRVSQRTGADYIRRRGEDCRAGQVLVPEWTRLSPGAVGLLASIGQVRLSVTCLPRVLHVATGNEIVDPGTEPAPGQIRDSNSTLVRAFLQQWGIVPIQVRAGEDLAEILAAVDQTGAKIDDIDLLIISGGASVGEHDCSRKLLETYGYELRISGTQVRPGKPLLFAMRRGSAAFALPGNPLAHFVCLNLYVRMALERFSGTFGPDGCTTQPGAIPEKHRSATTQPAQHFFYPGTLREDFNAEEGSPREILWPARSALGQRGPVLNLLPWKSSGDLTCLAFANALVRIPAGFRRLKAGSEVMFHPTVPPS